MKIIDSTLDLGGSAATEIKTLFGCQDLSDADFGDLLSRPIGGWLLSPLTPGSWQRRYWIRSDAQNEFIGWFCPAITANGTATTIDNGRIEMYVGEGILTTAPPRLPTGPSMSSGPSWPSATAPWTSATARRLMRPHTLLEPRLPRPGVSGSGRVGHNMYSLTQCAPNGGTSRLRTRTAALR